MCVPIQCFTTLNFQQQSRALQDMVRSKGETLEQTPRTSRKYFKGIQIL